MKCVVIKPLDFSWWYLCVLFKYVWGAQCTRWVSGLCRILWAYFHLHQNSSR